MRFTALPAVLLLLGSGAAFAFTLTPIVRDFTPSGPGTVQSFRLENEGSENVALRIRILTREMDEYGKEKLLPAEGLFLIYPPQVVLKPRSFQTLKVQWRGPAAVDTELSYRLLVEQMPVNFDDQTTPGGRIRIMFRYLGALYVVPPRPRPDVTLESSSPLVNDKGEKGRELVFRNSGNAHVLLGDLEISLRAADAPADSPPLVVSGDELKGINGENILAGRRRRYFLPLPEEYLRGDARISFTFTPIR